MAIRTTRRSTLLALAGGVAMAATGRAQQAHSQEVRAPAAILISNVRIFDGIGDQLTPGNLLVENHKIKQISSSAITAPPDATVINGGGRVLMPGLTDAHWHMTMATNTLDNLQQADTGLMYANTVAEARRTLLRGFTTVRDMAGPTFGIKDAIDAGVIPGPRVYPSGALISQTAGHGDFSPPYARPYILGGQPSHLEDIGVFVVANGVPEVLAAARNQLKKGASQVKIAVGGGVISDFDPIDSLQFTPDEIRAAVQAASDWHTYVAAHVYSSAGIRRALDAGVMSIEHGHLADEATIRLIGEKGAWLSTQPFEPGDDPLTQEQIEKTKSMVGAWERILGWAKKHGVKVAFGTDLLFQPHGTGKENVMLTRFSKIYSNVEVLKIATSGNCELFAMSGERNPYKGAKLGVLQEGAWADMLLVDGDPTQDISVLRDYERNFVVIIKDGVIQKRTLS
ncbi:MAG TPA: amidohydrolase family protein [Acetobacteraceae bacterium]|nr:amidohydrolase family protein [Acetobacteraceae bacterium]